MQPSEIASEYLTPRVVEAYVRAARFLGTEDVVVFRQGDGELQTFRREVFLQRHPCESLKTTAADENASQCFWYIIDMGGRFAYLSVSIQIVDEMVS